MWFRWQHAADLPTAKLTECHMPQSVKTATRDETQFSSPRYNFSVTVKHDESASEIGVPVTRYEAISNQSENCHVHDRPGRSRVVDSRQLISFTFSVQTGQLASLVTMTILTFVGYCLVLQTINLIFTGTVPLHSFHPRRTLDDEPPEQRRDVRGSIIQF